MSETATAPALKASDAFFVETVTWVQHWTSSLFSFRTTRDPGLRFSSGQFVMVGLMKEDGKPLVRAYTIASPAWHEELEFYSIKVPDGLTWNAILSTRDLLRELPGGIRESGPLDPEALLEMATSSYASTRDRKHSGHRRRMAAEFQRAYLDLIHSAARYTRRSVPTVLERVARRSAYINRFDRVTGDSATYATRKIMRRRRRFTTDQLHELIHRFVESQDLNPPAGGGRERRPPASETPDLRRALDDLIKVVARYRYGL